MRGQLFAKRRAGEQLHHDVDDAGAWVLRGTRMPVATIFENLEAGANIENILEWFDGLDREQIKALRFQRLRTMSGRLMRLSKP